MKLLSLSALCSSIMLMAGCTGVHYSAAVVASGPPVCPYGYYEEPPFTCAPDGYYGPEWFAGGVFIGAGPWYHGPRRFYGHVDHDFDYRKGYRGPTPSRGEAPRGQRAPFRGKATHDSRGRERPRR